MKLPFRKKVPSLDEERASQMLENVFEACGIEPNTVPMEALTSYSNYRKERFSLQRGILLLLLLLFLLLPFLFVLPRYEVVSVAKGDRGLPVYTVEVSGYLPIKRVTATMDIHSLPVYEKDKRTFKVEPTRNGELVINVALFNEQSVSTTIEVDGVDIACPYLTSSSTEDGYVYLYPADDDSGVDYSGVYAMTDSGETVQMVSCDAESGEIVLEYPVEPVELYIPDQLGNILHLRLYMQEEN